MHRSRTMARIQTKPTPEILEELRGMVESVDEAPDKGEALQALVGTQPRRIKGWWGVQAEQSTREFFNKVRLGVVSHRWLESEFARGQAFQGFVKKHQRHWVGEASFDANAKMGDMLREMEKRWGKTRAEIGINLLSATAFAAEKLGHREVLEAEPAPTLTRQEQAAKGKMRGTAQDAGRGAQGAPPLPGGQRKRFQGKVVVQAVDVSKPWNEGHLKTVATFDTEQEAEAYVKRQMEEDKKPKEAGGYPYDRSQKIEYHIYDAEAAAREKAIFDARHGRGPGLG